MLVSAYCRVESVDGEAAARCFVEGYELAPLCCTDHLFETLQEQPWGDDRGGADVM